MYTDIIELREFYQSPRGRMAADILRTGLARYATHDNGAHVLVGFAPPFALPTLPQMVLMPAQQGVSPWPHDGDNRAVLTDDHAWPLADSSVDTVTIMHALEYSADAGLLLREAWRVLKGQGRLLMVVTNRRGLWARAEATPFGRGQPYSATQLRTLLRQAQFVPEGWHRTLFTPPFKSRSLLASAPLWEKAGPRLCPSFGGVTIMHAAKQLYAPTGRVETVRRIKLAPPQVLTPAAGFTSEL